MKKVFLGLIATVMFSVAGNAQNLREKFLEGKSEKEIVKAFQNLKPEEKNALWNEKMEQLLSQDIPKEHKMLINEIKEFFQKNTDSENGKIFIGLSLKLAEITPMEDLHDMFATLKDYHFKGEFQGKTKATKELISEIESLQDISDNEEGKAACVCRWCIGGGSVSTDCRVTSDGCGWFGMQSCTHCSICW